MKKKLLLGTAIALITLTGNGIINATNRDSISADEKPPIVQQVEDHEVRIGTLETNDAVQDQNIAQNSGETVIVKDRVVTVEKQIEAQPWVSSNLPTPQPETPPAPVVIDPYKVTNFERIYHTNGQYPLLKCIYTTYNGDVWWYAARSSSVKDEPCQFNNPEFLTATMRKQLTNRPIDVF